MARPMRWTRALGVPMSEGGMPICSKHEFIESNLGDADMEYEMSEAVRAASKDGQNMEDALKERKEQLEEANSEIECMERELLRLRIAHLRRMADAVDSRASGWADVLRTVPDYPSLQPRDRWRRRWLVKMEKLHAAINTEIARLRGEG